MISYVKADEILYVAEIPFASKISIDLENKFHIGMFNGPKSLLHSVSAKS